MDKFGYMQNGKLFSPLLESLVSRPSTPLDALFSLTEMRALDTLNEKKNRVVSREEIAKSIWGAEDWEEKYSEWAIGQLIYRLRKKLNESQKGIDIKTKKAWDLFL